MSALWAFLGVVVGVAFTSAVTFWSTRRKELEAAAVAGLLLVDELRLLVEDPGESAERNAHVASLHALWLERRDALVLYLEPTRFSVLNRTLAHAARRGALPVDEAEAILGWFGAEATRIRDAHQAFILTPLIKYLRTRPWRRRPRATSS